MSSSRTIKHFKRIFLFSDLTEDAQKFLQILKDQFDIPVIFSTYDRSLKFENTDLIILEVDNEQIQEMQNALDDIQLQLESPSVALFVESEEVNISSLITRFMVKGVFNMEMDEPLITRGINKIDEGSFWFSRDQYETITRMRKGADLAQFCKKYKLTMREKQILFYLMDGSSIQQMAQQLFIAENTIKTHRNRLYKKLGVSSGFEAIHLVHKQTI